jgi:transposase
MPGRACGVDALGQREAPDNTSADGDAGEVDAKVAVEAGREIVPLCLGDGGHRGRGGGVLWACTSRPQGATHIGVDEISRKRGHVYVTNVYDLQRKRLVWSGEGRSKETLEGFFEFLGPERSAALEGICCDMWQPYVDVIKARAPQAVLVFDKFHIVRHLMAAVDQVRRDEIREKGPAHKALMYKTRFIWLKNPWNLTDAQAFRLGELERLNLKINRAYLLKELFRHFWDYRRAGWAKHYLKKWFWWATHSRLTPMRDFAWMVRRHEDDILNYFRTPIDNGTVEGLNNKAKLVIHKAYGFRTAKNYIRNLYHCLGNLPLPQTVHTFV